MTQKTDSGWINPILPAEAYPKSCFSAHPTKQTIIRIDRHESGYTPVASNKYATYEDALAAARTLNTLLGIGDCVREAMEIGSAFGWHAPGANPLTHHDAGLCDCDHTDADDDRAALDATAGRAS